MSERILIAGCGDLGVRVAERLLGRGDTVYGLRRRPPAESGSDIHWLSGDLSNSHSLTDLPEQITQMVYLPTPDIRAEHGYRTVFIDGLRHLFGAMDLSALTRVVFVSSTAVYGEHDGQWVDEDTVPEPMGFNGRTLLEAERLLSTQPMRSVVLRLAGLYGPGRMQLVERLRAGHAFAPREPIHWANRMHVDDAAAAIVHLLNLSDPLPLYIGVDDTPLALHDLYQHVARLSGAPDVPDGPAPIGIGSKRLRNVRLRASGFEPLWPDAREGYAALLQNEAHIDD